MPPSDPDVAASRWWRDGVLYQIYPRSFADSTGSGHGDLRGVIEHLDHLSWLGVDGIWLSPINPSPDADWGYDVADYTDVDPDFGTIEDLDRLVAEAADRGIRVLIDLVPNHTSDRHAWFVDARSCPVGRAPRLVRLGGRQARRLRRPTTGDPRSAAPHGRGTKATGQYYLHNFLPEQPDLNWWNPEVADAFDDIVRFWLDRGLAGFRIDVAHALVKDRDLRDDTPALETDHPRIRRHGLRSDFSMNRPEAHDVLRRWRGDRRRTSQGVLLGETWVLDLEALARFYGTGEDELHLALNVPFVFSTPGAEMREIVERTQAVLPPAAWPLWNGSNHDAGRFASRWCDGDERRTRASCCTLLTLRGTPLLYYGDEIGMRNVDVPRDRLKDPVGIRHWPDDPGRDKGRTPMQWTSDGGFSSADVEPWLPMGDAAARNVADQREDPDSMLHLCRDLIAFGASARTCAPAPTKPLEAPDGIWAWRRGEADVGRREPRRREPADALGRTRDACSSGTDSRAGRRTGGGAPSGSTPGRRSCSTTGG